jgi:hypothetical protein
MNVLLLVMIIGGFSTFVAGGFLVGDVTLLAQNFGVFDESELAINNCSCLDPVTGDSGPEFCDAAVNFTTSFCSTYNSPSTP